MAPCPRRGGAERGEDRARTDRCGGLALSEWRGVDAGYAHVVAVGLVCQALARREEDLGLVVAVELDLTLLQAKLRDDILDVAQLCALGSGG